MADNLKNKTPEQIISILKTYPKENLDDLLQSVALLWLDNYFLGQNPFQIKNLIRNLAKNPSKEFITLLAYIHDIGQELIPEKEEQIRYERLMNRDFNKTQKQLEIIISLVDISKELIKKYPNLIIQPNVDSEDEESEEFIDTPIEIKEEHNTSIKEDSKDNNELPQYTLIKESQYQETDSLQEDDEEFEDDDFEDEPYEEIPVEEVIEKPIKTTTPEEDLQLPDEEFSDFINNLFFDLKTITRAKIPNLEQFTSELSTLYDILKQPKDAENALKIAQLFKNKSLKEIFEFISFTKFEHDIDTNFVGFILASLIYSQHIPIMDLEDIELEFTYITNLLRNKPQLLNIYFNLWLIVKKLQTVTQEALKKARLENNIFNTAMLLEELEKEKFFSIILEDYLTTKLGIKLKTDAGYKKQIENANLNLILHFVVQKYPIHFLIEIYQHYGYFKLSDKVKKELPPIEILPLIGQISNYKLSSTAKDISTTLVSISPRKTFTEHPTNLYEVFSNLVSRYFDIEITIESNYNSLIRDTIQAVLKYALSNNWNIEDTIYNLSLAILCNSKHSNSIFKLRFIVYALVQELILGIQNLQYKLDTVISGLAKVTAKLLTEPPSNDLKEYLKDDKLKNILYKTFTFAIFDILLEIYESISLAQTTIKTFIQAINTEKERLELESQKYKLRNFLQEYSKAI